MRDPHAELKALGITPTSDAARAWREGERQAWNDFAMERAQMAGRIAQLEAVLHEVGLISRRAVRRTGS